MEVVGATPTLQLSAQQLAIYRLVVLATSKGASVGLAQRIKPETVDACSLNLEALVCSIAAGDELAEVRFYNATSGLVFGLLLLMLSDNATADKVLLEVYGEVRHQAARFDKTDQNLLTWLITIAHRRALENLCSKTEDRQFVVSIGLAGRQRSGVNGGFAINKAAHRRLVGWMLDGVSLVERKMIELAYCSRMTPRAIALELGQSPATVNNGLQSGIAQLYRLFKNRELLS